MDKTAETLTIQHPVESILFENILNYCEENDHWTWDQRTTFVSLFLTRYPEFIDQQDVLLGFKSLSKMYLDARKQSNQ